MRLRDLDGHFVNGATITGSHLMTEDTVHGAQGVMFQCPSCAVGRERGEEDGRRFVRGAHYIRTFFSNPIGAVVAPIDADLRNDKTPNPRWQIISGATLDDLTLSPSINCDIPQKDAKGVEHPSSCKFHGFVKNGDVA